MSFNGITGGGVISGNGTLTTKCLSNWYKFDLGDLSGGFLFNYANKKYDGGFNGVVTDISSGNYKFGTASMYPNGQYIQAYALNDTSITFKQGISLSVWFYQKNDLDGIYLGIQDNLSYQSNGGYNILVNGYNPNLYITFIKPTSVNVWQYNANCGITLNKWYNLVLVLNPVDSSVSLFVNGTRYIYQVLTGNNYPNFYPKYAGCGAIGYGPMSGFNDDLRQYNYALSDSRVIDICNNVFSF
jgi:hypothetical protein